MTWYIAKSLEVLRAQLNKIAPNRSTVSDGGIGDAAHSARLSDHNPTASGQVCARDFTNDPAGGCGGQWLADALVRSRDIRIKYIIFNHHILDTRPGQHPWTWQPYNPGPGGNAHEHHVHVSVFAGGLGDSTAPWNLGTTSQEDDVELSDMVTLYGNEGQAKLNNVLAGIFSNAKDALAQLKALNAVVAGQAAAIAKLASDPDITVEQMRELVNDAVAEHVQITGTVQIGAKS